MPVIIHLSVFVYISVKEISVRFEKMESLQSTERMRVGKLLSKLKQNRNFLNTGYDTYISNGKTSFTL